MNPEPKQLSPLAIEMIGRSTCIVIAHTPPEGYVKVELLTPFARRFRNLLRAGHCVCIRHRKDRCTLVAVLDLQMSILPPKGAQP